MIVNVTVIEETHYTIDILDAMENADEYNDELYAELSCEPCVEDIHDVKGFLDDRGIRYDTYKQDTNSRIEMWR